MRKFLLVCAAVFALAACGDSSPKIDTSTPESYTTSVQKVSASLTPEKKEAFEKAIMAIVWDASVKAGGGEKSEKAAMDAINGKTADDIIKAATDIKN
ncbi:hypothetical protein LPW36_02185 [Jinshanibacter sp. LJY008]|uniref:Lipoprotein n=1 Tax=Limnobaculum eriocheiris TaxID=2897391 RepID=A0A9X1MTX0_9GAMM|nr:DUF6694 family lipoprotein [Limnobaculum eriocheiris]MCD1124854.1 hypothetical protein [Limnobaculum eriocheiris]